MNYLIVVTTILLHTIVSCAKEPSSLGSWLGNFTVEQTCDGAANPTYTMKVRQVSEDSSTLTLDNLGGYGKKVEATVQGDSLAITPTDVSAGLIGNVRLSGTGRREEGKLLIDLTVRVPGPQGTTTTSTCQLQGRRQ